VDQRQEVGCSAPAIHPACRMGGEAAPGLASCVARFQGQDARAPGWSVEATACNGDRLPGSALPPPCLREADVSTTEKESRGLCGLLLS